MVRSSTSGDDLDIQVEQGKYKNTDFSSYNLKPLTAIHPSAQEYQECLISKKCWAAFRKVLGGVTISFFFFERKSEKTERY